MPACTALLDELLELSKTEERALTAEDMEKVEQLSGRRAVLLRQALNSRAGCDDNVLVAKLEQVLERQRRLQSIADGLYVKYKQQQNAGRKQARYFNSDRYIHAETKKSFYCDTTF